MGLAAIANRVAKFAADNSPTILSAVAVVGTVTTAYLTGKTAYKASEIISSRRFEVTYEVEMREMVDLTWKLYIPPVACGLATVACIILANRIGDRRATAMAAGYAVLDKAFTEYKEKVYETVGDRKEEKIRDEIAQERVDKTYSTEVTILGTGEVLCYDKYSDRYFKSDVESIKAAQNKINYQINTESSASLSDFYDFIGLPHVGSSDEFGWSLDRLMDIQFSTTLTSSKEPCVVVEFAVQPVRNFYRLS